MADHGIESIAVADRYRLGVVIEPLSGDEGFTGMLCFPYLTSHGVKAVKFRNLSGNGPKNMVPEGQPVRLYNADAYFNADGIVGLAEGEADAIAATES